MKVDWEDPKMLERRRRMYQFSAVRECAENERFTERDYDPFVIVEEGPGVTVKKIDWGHYR